jgi:hypothetical protein
MLNKLYFGITLTLRKIKWNSMTDFNAFLLFWLCLLLNIISILMLISIISKIPYYQKGHTIMPNEIIIITTVSFFIIMYIVFYKRREKIFIKYENISQRKMLIIQVLTWIYIITTFIILYYTADKYR